MASRGDQHCANCIGTLSFPIAAVLAKTSEQTEIAWRGGLGLSQGGAESPPPGEEWATLKGASLRCGLSLKFFDHLLYFTKSNKADSAPLWVVTLSARKVVPCVRWPATGWHYCTQFIAKPKAACALRFSWAATSSNLGL